MRHSDESAAFLIIGGPVGDGLDSYVLYFWDGEDCIPGDDSPWGMVSVLGTFPSSGQEKPEGIAVRSADQRGWDLVLVCDGAAEAKRFRVPKP